MAPRIRVRCPQCTLTLVDAPHPDVTYERDGNGNILCPNDHTSMVPVGETATKVAEAAFAEAQHMLDEQPEQLPPAETVDSLSKRLRAIDEAREAVGQAQATYDSAKSRAKAAKDHLDETMTTLVSVCRTMAGIPSALPLFTAEAAQAAEATPTDTPPETSVVDLWGALTSAGYMAATPPLIASWTPEQRAQAAAWVPVGTIEALPTFMVGLMPVEDAGDDVLLPVQPVA